LKILNIIWINFILNSGGWNSLYDSGWCRWQLLMEACQHKFFRTDTRQMNNTAVARKLSIESHWAILLSYILSQYVKNCSVRVSNRGDHCCCYGYSLNTLHIPNKIPPPLKTFWILQLYISTCASVLSMANIAECVVYFPLFHTPWCSRRLWWTVYDSRACCSLVSSFIQRGALMIEVRVSMCLRHCPLLNKVAVVRMCDTVLTLPWQLFFCLCLLSTEGQWGRFCFEYLGFPLSL
jgi:hypothetical protein